MSKRSPEFVSEKLGLVLLHLVEGKSIGCLAKHQNLHQKTQSNWVQKYKEAGVEGLEAIDKVSVGKPLS